MDTRRLLPTFILLLIFIAPFGVLQASGKKHLVIISVCSLKMNMLPGYSDEHMLKKNGGFSYLAKNGAIFDGVYASHPYNGLLVSIKNMFRKEKIFSFNDFQFFNVGIPINWFKSDLLKEGVSYFSPSHGVNYLEENLEVKLDHIRNLLASTELKGTKKAAILVQLKELHFSMNQKKSLSPHDNINEVGRMPYFIYRYQLQALRRKGSALRNSDLNSFYSAYSVVSSPERIESWRKSPKFTSDLQMIRGAYSSKLSNLDNSLKTLIDIIHSKLGKERTLIMVVGDHGESLMEDGRLGHAFSVTPHYTKVPFYLIADEIEPQKYVLNESINFEQLRNYIAEWSDGNIDTKGLLSRITLENRPKGFALASCSGKEFGYIKGNHYYIHSLETKKNTLLTKQEGTQVWIESKATQADIAIFEKMQAKYLNFLKELWKQNPGRPTTCIVNHFDIYPDSIFDL